MFTAASSGNLDGLLALVEYVRDPKKRAKELIELRDARDTLSTARKELERAADGAKKLSEAAKTLALAQTQASNDIANAKTTAEQIIADAEKKAGDLTGAREHVNATAEALKGERTSFDKTLAAATKELERRETRVTKRENDIGRMRDDLGKDKLAFRRKAENVEAAMKG